VADATLAKAVARVTFKMHDDPAAKTLVASLDPKAAHAAFDAVAKTCAFRDGDLSSFSAVSRQPMTPDFDIIALSSDAVDNVLRCDELASFFLDAKTRYPKPATLEPAPSAAPAPAPPPH
jgi:hypothetical protein